MRIFNTISEYGIISKSFHWITAILLFLQIPAGFYLVGLDFGEERITVENYHIIGGLIIFYLTIFRLIYKIFNPTPLLTNNIFSRSKINSKIKSYFFIFNNFHNYDFRSFKKTFGR